MKILIVTFPYDLGSRTIETNLVKFISLIADVEVFRFAAQDSDEIDQGLNNRKSLIRRFQDTWKLRRAVRQAVAEGRKILFYNISPAMFAYGSWRGGEAYITMDWARRLLTPGHGKALTGVSRIHQKVLQSCAGLLPMTDAMEQCLIGEYGISRSKIHRVPSLFDLEHFDPGELTSGERVRLLYVGGDAKRKGGHLVYDAFRSRLKDVCTLTMVTNFDFPPCEGFTLRKNIRYGTPEHLELMRGYDVFVLPTRQDAGPQVIGEAAAAGLAVITTRHALGAPHVVTHGINGFISDSPESCIEDLVELVQFPEKIRQMRTESLQHMRKHFLKNVIASAYAKGMSH